MIEPQKGAAEAASSPACSTQQVPVNRILQLHPTRRCNLRCTHCYSQSGPDESAGLAREVVIRVLDGARAEGYTVAGFSGGEPMLYPPLGECLEHARALGMVTTVTTNGTTLSRRSLERVAPHTSLFAVSVDGRPESHDVIRASDTAFDRMRSRLPLIRETGVPFGFIFTLTEYNLDELPWVINFALEEEAALLQIHPLETAGRAIEEMRGDNPDRGELAYAAVLVEKLRPLLGDRLRLQFDAADTVSLEHQPFRVLGAKPEEGTEPPLSELLGSLVLEADGWLVPVQYGMARRYALGDATTEELSTLKTRWVTQVYPEFQTLRENLRLRLLEADDELPFLNWFEELGRAADLQPGGK